MPIHTMALSLIHISIAAAMRRRVMEAICGNEAVRAEG